MSSINRSAHALQKERALVIPRHFVFFDTETTQHVTENGDIEQRFRLGWAVYWRRPYLEHKEVTEWLEFTSIGAFWEFLFDKAKPKQKLWVIARNVVFDFTICQGWSYLKAEGFKLRFFHNNGASAIVTVQKESRTIAFLDSMNWFTESLAATGERIGIPKMKIDFDTCTESELSIYCRNDVLIELENYRIFIKFMQDNRIGRIAYTKASTAMAAYMYRHYNYTIYIHNNAEAIALERASYKGGRCECFRLGDLSGQTYHVVDVNSLYPSVMLGNNYPHKYIQLHHKLTHATLESLLAEYAVVASVTLQTEEPVYAIKHGRTIFPVGNFDAVLCTPELKYALEHGHIVSIGDAVSYEQAQIFDSYVTTMYGLRNEFRAAKNREYEQLCKYLLNSLYGKFGQKAENWVKIGDAPGEPDREEMILHAPPKKSMRLRYLLGELFELKSHGEAYNSFPAIAAHVTAYARMYLWHLMCVCGYGEYVYCDTDSLVVTDRGLENLGDYLHETELGKLKHEKSVTTLVIRGLKDYTMGSCTKCKGVRSQAVQLSDSVFTQQQWPSFRGLMKSPDINTYVVKNVTKHLSREYTKGNVTYNGHVKPFVLVPNVSAGRAVLGYNPLASIPAVPDLRLSILSATF